MSDDSFFREVDEELRTERVRKFWDSYGRLVIAAAVLLVAGIAGWRYWEYSAQVSAQRSGDAFMSAVQLAEQGKSDEAVTALKALESESEGSYETLARLRAASEQAKAGDATSAIATYDAIIADGAANENLRAIARIRAGMLLVDEGSVADVEQRVGPLAAPGAPWRNSAREALGLAHYSAGSLQAAFEQFDTIAKDNDAPQSMRQRMRIMLDLIASQGGPVQAQ